MESASASRCQIVNCGLHQSGRTMKRGLLQSAVAVLAGNFVYFWILSPLLPSAARHAPFRFDLGLLLDAWVCLVAYGLLELLWRSRRGRG